MRSPVLSSVVLSDGALSYEVLSRLFLVVLPYLVLSSVGLSYLVLPCLVGCCRVLSGVVCCCLVLSCLVLFCVVLTSVVLSCLALPLSSSTSPKGSVEICIDALIAGTCPRPCPPSPGRGR